MTKRDEMLRDARWVGRDFANSQRGSRDESPSTVDRMLRGSTGEGLKILWEAKCRARGWEPGGVAWEACQMAFRRRMTGAD